MSKQTNAFQQLVHYIYQSVEGVGATVTESALLYEQNTSKAIPREIDVLIEKNVANQEKLRIAVECRDRKCRDDIQWVDSLVGKFLNLPVDKVIAVSNSGYSPAAHIKAEANKIDLKTLEEAYQINFGDQFAKLGMAFVKHQFEIRVEQLECHPHLGEMPKPNWRVFHFGIPEGNLAELVGVFTRRYKDEKLHNLNQKFSDEFKTKRDIEKSIPPVSKKYDLENYIIQTTGGHVHQLLSITLRCEVKPTVQPINMRHRTLEGALVTEGEITISDDNPQGHRSHTVYLAQLPHTTEGKYFVRSK